MGYKMVYASAEGEIRFSPELSALGRSGDELWELRDEEMIPMPAGADLLTLPGYLPVGLDPLTGDAEILDEDDDEQVMAVAALLPMGYTRTMLPAFENSGAKPLSLYGYAAVAASEDGRLYVAGLATEVSLKWDPHQYADKLLEGLIEQRLNEFPQNRIIQQLAHCSRDYHCLTAQNMFFRRWEAGIPTSPVCNARCLGCISEQPSECCPSPQRRLNFLPTVDEIVELGVAHLDGAEDGIISFGQGCEGEPLLSGERLIQATRRIRERTSKGTININTNAGATKTMRGLIDAGLDAVRISLLSARADDYVRYHQPQDYSFENVVDSLRNCHESAVLTSLNLLFFPGFTDRLEQWEALRSLLDQGWVDRIQIRNLNIDPDHFLHWMDGPSNGGEAMGVRTWLERLQTEYPMVRIGSFSHPKDKSII